MKEKIKGMTFFVLTTAVQVVNGAGDSDMNETDTNIDSQPGILIPATPEGYATLAVLVLVGVIAGVLSTKLLSCLYGSLPCCRGKDNDEENVETYSEDLFTGNNNTDAMRYGRQQQEQEYKRFGCW